MSLTVHLIHAPPGWDKPLTFHTESEVADLLRKLVLEFGPDFLARHPGLHGELVNARWVLMRGWRCGDANALEIGPESSRCPETEKFYAEWVRRDA